jgi:hypothetical protein
MTEYIGPIQIDVPHVREEDKISGDGSENINIVCSSIKAKQLIGLAENVVKNEYGPVRIIRGLNNRWGVMPVDTSENLAINEGRPHRGFYVLGPGEEKELNPAVSMVQLPAELVSNNLNEFLTLLYSQGGEDDIYIESTFTDTESSVVHENDYSSNYTDTWESYLAYYMSPGSVSVSGGEMVLTGTKSGSPGYGGWGRLILRNLATYKPPWTLEFDMEYVTGSNCHLSFFILENNPDNISFVTNTSTSNYLRVVLQYSSGSLKMGVARCRNGSVSWLVPLTTLNVSTENNPNFQLKYYPDGSLEVGVDKTGGTSFQNVWGKAKTGHVWSNPFFMMILSNSTTSTATMNSSNFKISVEENAVKNNIVVAPPDANCNLTPDFTRASEEGTIKCFQNPLESINYQITPVNFYKGTVKAMNGNYTDSTYRLVTHNGMDLDPEKFYVSNGLLKLVTTLNGVEFHYWNGTGYDKLNTFTLPSNISLIRPFQVTPWEFTLQLDRTYWAIRAGKPFTWVKHLNDPLGFTRKSCYYHDTTTTTDPIADADISMDDQFYCLVWDKGTGTCSSPIPDDIYRLMIIKKDPTTIKSDSIPASSMTGIGLYNSTIASDNVNGYLSLAREWHKPTIQALAIQGI